MNQNKWLNFLLAEATVLPQEAYSVIEDELNKSDYINFRNRIEDIIGDSTPLSDELSDVLTKAMRRLGLPIRVRVSVKPELPDDIVDGPYVAGASHSVGGIMERIEIEIYAFPEEGITAYADEMNGDLAEVIRHELIHSGQLRKQAVRKGMPLRQAHIERGHDKRQVPQAHEQDPKFREIYHSRHSEIEAYAHQTAEWLLKHFSKEDALGILTRPEESGIAKMDRFAHLKNRPKALKKFMKKVYEYINLLG